MEKRFLVMVLFLALFLTVGLHYEGYAEQDGDKAVEEQAELVDEDAIADDTAAIEDEIEEEIEEDAEEVTEEEIAEERSEEEEIVEERSEEEIVEEIEEAIEEDVIVVAPGNIWEELEEMDSQIEIMTGVIDDFLKLGRSKTATEKEARTQFNNFEQEFKNTSAQADTLYKTAEAVRSSGQLYFDKWQQELEALKNASLRRRGENEIKKELRIFSDFNKETQQAQETLEGVINDLEDIARYLRFDLTLKNVKSISGELRKIDKNATKVQKEMHQMKRGLEKLSSLSQILEDR